MSDRKQCLFCDAAALDGWVCGASACAERLAALERRAEARNTLARVAFEEGFSAEDIDEMLDDGGDDDGLSSH
jgi:hypothetical protein